MFDSPAHIEDSPRLPRPGQRLGFQVQASLGHANTRAFLAHGGASSLEEGITAGLPLIVAPGGGDQNLNWRVAEDAGLGVVVALEKITSEALAATIVRVGITEPGFRATALRLQRLARDADGSRVAADAVEAAARWGTGHLSSKLDTMNWFLRNDYDLLLTGLVRQKCLESFDMPARGAEFTFASWNFAGIQTRWVSDCQAEALVLVRPPCSYTTSRFSTPAKTWLAKSRKARASRENMPCHHSYRKNEKRAGT